MKKRIISVVGARPNFMKIAPIQKAFVKFNSRKPELNIEHLICHTGQHYDEKMSQVFFADLELPRPDFYLGVGSGSHAEQTAKIMVEFEKVLEAQKPVLIIVVGDVNSTLAASLTAVKKGVKVAHVEAGLRSFDRTMPEEINRIVTDSISDYLFVTERSAISNLNKEGVDNHKVFFVGNTMIDSLKFCLPKIEHSEFSAKLKSKGMKYALVTFHRPSNVDNRDKVEALINLIYELSTTLDVIFPMHPRTKDSIRNFGLHKKISSNVKFMEPVGYIDFISLIKNSTLVITDSGGIQEETTYLGVPCITMRSSTERPVTTEVGTNCVVGDDFENAKMLSRDIIAGRVVKGKIPELWDGNAAERIVDVIVQIL